MDPALLAAMVSACRSLIESRFPDGGDRGAAAMLLADGTVATGTSPDAINPAVEVCHEVEPYCAAFRLGLPVLASVSLHRRPDHRVVVVSPCGVCRERLATYGPDVLVAVPEAGDPTRPHWKRLAQLLPDHWMAAFPDEFLEWA